MLDRYMDSPVLMSFNSNPKPITEIPFPAITICNMNKARTVRTSIINPTTDVSRKVKG